MKIRCATLVYSQILLIAAAWCAPASTVLAAVETEMNDQSITDKVDEELLFDPGVLPTKIDVSTSNGIVTLDGQVNNILAKERSTRIAETVKGVRAVINTIDVAPTVTRSDTQIKNDVESALVEDPAAEAYEIAVTVDDGEVTLGGTVDSFQERELVTTVVKGVRGVTEIDDQIDIEYKTDRADNEIQSEIEQTLRWNKYIDNYLVDVNVDDGKVSLSGTVGSAAEKRMAETDAWVAGVTSVDVSQLKVSEWTREDKLRGDKYVIKSADEIRDAVNDALLQDPRVMSFNVDVDVDGSTVTLRGEVDNLKARRAAEQDANHTVGVSYVNNRLKIRMDGWPDDSVVAEDIRSALLRDPYVERYEVTVSVVDGTAHLYGTVDSYFDKNRADEVASRIAGVIDVENHLNVDYDDTTYIYDPYIDDAYVLDDNLIDFEQRAPLRSDSEIKDSIDRELWWSPFVESDQVTVMVDDGVATLTGAVDTWNERQAATENAYQGGATLVDNDLTVNYD